MKRKILFYSDLKDLAKNNPGDIYVIGSKSGKFLGNIIVWLSSFVDKKKGLPFSFDHVVLASYQKESALFEQIHQTDPHMKRQRYSPRKFNVVYKVVSPDAPFVWARAAEQAANASAHKYGYAQLIFKIFYILFGLKLFRGGRDCIEAVMQWVNPDYTSKQTSYYTVAEGIKELVNQGYITPIGDFRI